MPEVNRVCIALPSHDFRYDVEVVSSLLQILAASGGTVQPYFSCGDSNIAHHRNSIAHAFKTLPTYKDCDTLVWVDSDIGFTVQDFMYLCEGDADVVIGPYSEKNTSGRMVEWGMGFARVHRSVFEKLDDWMVDAPDGSGKMEALHRYYLNGELAVDYHYNGAMSNMRWHGEDTGFWHWCSLVGGLKLRKETRTKLVHYGRWGFRQGERPPAALEDDGAQ